MKRRMPIVVGAILAAGPGGGPALAEAPLAPPNRGAYNQIYNAGGYYSPYTDPRYGGYPATDLWRHMQQYPSLTNGMMAYTGIPQSQTYASLTGAGSSGSLMDVFFGQEGAMGKRFLAFLGRLFLVPIVGGVQKAVDSYFDRAFYGNNFGRVTAMKRVPLQARPPSGIPSYCSSCPPQGQRPPYSDVGAAVNRAGGSAPSGRK